MFSQNSLTDMSVHLCIYTLNVIPLYSRAHSCQWVISDCAYHKAKSCQNSSSPLGLHTYYLPQCVRPVSSVVPWMTLPSSISTSTSTWGSMDTVVSLLTRVSSISHGHRLTYIALTMRCSVGLPWSDRRPTLSRKWLTTKTMCEGKPVKTETKFKDIGRVFVSDGSVDHPTSQTLLVSVTWGMFST